jgi:hypothetical protein
MAFFKVSTVKTSTITEEDFDSAGIRKPAVQLVTIEI